MRRLPLALALVITLLAGCREDEPEPTASCSIDANAVLAALQRAPAAVTLQGGARLSECLGDARTDGDLQAVGLVYVRAGEQLARTADVASALQLGYLVGAAQRGSRNTSGIHLELVRRLEQTAGVGGPSGELRTPYERGLAAGRRAG